MSIFLKFWVQLRSKSRKYDAQIGLMAAKNISSLWLILFQGCISAFVNNCHIFSLYQFNFFWCFLYRYNYIIHPCLQISLVGWFFGINNYIRIFQTFSKLSNQVFWVKCLDCFKKQSNTNKWNVQLSAFAHGFVRKISSPWKYCWNL